MKDYEVYTTIDTHSWLYKLLVRIGIVPESMGMRVEEGKIIRTNKTKKEIREYFSGSWTKVLSVTECTITKDQEIPII